MSSYIKTMLNPKTGKAQKAVCLDNYFRSHIYGYGFMKNGIRLNNMLYKLFKMLFYKQIVNDIENMFGFHIQYKFIEMYDHSGRVISMSWEEFKKQFKR